jgi:maleamate amidohydrolase
MNHQHAWEDVIDEEIRSIAGNYASRMGLRDKPALLCIDNYNAVFGDKPEPLQESMKRFPSSCGLAGWNAVEPTQKLMAAAREAGVPVMHTKGMAKPPEVLSSSSATKRSNMGQDMSWQFSHFDQLAPRADEIVIEKLRASAFYGTPLNAYLTQLGVNTLIFCGNSTSGCVRASAVDGYQAGYNVAVVEECVFDRNWLSHKVNLFDLNCKYADVMFLDEVLDYLSDL